MAQNIGINAPTRIPTFGDDASIEEALRKYHYGIDQWSGDPVQNNLGMDGNFKAVKDRLTAAEAAIADIVGDGGGFVRSESRVSSPNTIVPQNENIVALTINAKTSGQTEPLQRWRNSSLNNVAVVFPSGAASFRRYLTVGDNNVLQSTTVGINLSLNNALHKGIVVRAAMSQTENLQEWQNSSGQAISWIDKEGRIYYRNDELSGNFNPFFLIGT
jgi:hypothetical protein